MRKKCKEEKAALGYFVSGHPTHEFLANVPDRVAYVSSMSDGDNLHLVIFSDELTKNKLVQGKKKMFKFTVSDESGSIELTHFAKPGASTLEEGRVYEMTGFVNTFQGKNTILLKSFKPVV